MTIARDSTGFEDIDEFWDAEVVAVTPVADNEKAQSWRQSSVSVSTEAESFDYDTSDSIDEEEGDEEEEGEGEREEEGQGGQGEVEGKVQAPRGRRDSQASRKSIKSINADIEYENENVPGRRYRGSSVGGRDSMLSNFTLESSIGGTLPLEDSDEENEEHEMDEGDEEEGTSSNDRNGDRLSLDSLYDQRRESTNTNTTGNRKGRRSSIASTRDGARGRMENNNNDSNGKDDDDDVSVDTTDMSAIPAGDNSFEMGGGDENPDFGDDFGDTFDPTGLEGEGSNEMVSSKNARKSSVGKTNRRVSFGEGTKPGLKEKEDTNNDNNNDDNGDDEYDNYQDNHNDQEYNDEENTEQENGSRRTSSSKKNRKSTTPTRNTAHTTNSAQSSNSNNSSSSTHTTPTHHSGLGPGSSSSGAMYSMGTTPGSNEFARGRVIDDESFVEDEEDTMRNSDSEEEEGSDDNDKSTDRSYVEDTSFLKAIKSRIQRKDGGDRRDSRASTDQEEDDEEEEEEEEEADDEDRAHGMRRSSRITKGKRMAYWRGERPVYQKGRMVGMLVADKTPLKMKKQVTKKRKSVVMSSRNDQTDSEDDEAGNVTMDTQEKKRGRRVVINDSDEESEITFPKGLKFLKRSDSDELSIWDDSSDAPKTLKVVCHSESLQPPSALPMTAVRLPGKEGVGSAAQSFNVPEIAGIMSGWISGFVELPAGAIKDAEGVGECSQVFFVSECQDDGVEFGIADPREDEWRDETAQRILIRKGDSFYVPPGNIYRLENHSLTKPCTLFWTIVRPMDQKTVAVQMSNKAGVVRA